MYLYSILQHSCVLHVNVLPIPMPSSMDPEIIVITNNH